MRVTDKAAAYLLRALDNKDEGAPEALRIVYSEDAGYEFALDDPKDGDEVFQQDSRSYLVVDAELAKSLLNATLDVQESPQGTRITLAGYETPVSETAEEES